jgi:hypothetical protein
MTENTIPFFKNKKEIEKVFVTAKGPYFLEHKQSLTTHCEEAQES